MDVPESPVDLQQAHKTPDGTLQSDADEEVSHVMVGESITVKVNFKGELELMTDGHPIEHESSGIWCDRGNDTRTRDLQRQEWASTFSWESGTSGGRSVSILSAVGPYCGVCE